jgi:hypothetical protein
MKILRIIIGIFFLIFSFGAVDDSMIACILYFIAALVIFPISGDIVSNVIRSLLKVEDTRPMRVIIVVIAFVVGSTFIYSSSGFKGREQLRYQEKEQKKQLETAKAHDDRIKDEQWANSRAGQMCAENPEWKRSTCELLADGKVRIGMTKAQAQIAWGYPSNVNNITSGNGTFTTWCYGDYCQRSLHFQDGELTLIQTR